MSVWAWLVLLAHGYKDSRGHDDGDTEAAQGSDGNMEEKELVKGGKNDLQVSGRYCSACLFPLKPHGEKNL